MPVPDTEDDGVVDSVVELCAIVGEIVCDRELTLGMSVRVGEAVSLGHEEELEPKVLEPEKVIDTLVVNEGPPVNERGVTVVVGISVASTIVEDGVTVAELLLLNVDKTVSLLEGDAKGVVSGVADGDGDCEEVGEDVARGVIDGDCKGDKVAVSIIETLAVKDEVADGVSTPVPVKIALIDAAPMAVIAADVDRIADKIADADVVTCTVLVSRATGGVMIADDEKNKLTLDCALKVPSVVIV